MRAVTLPLELDRASPATLTQQLVLGVAGAIRRGVLRPGAVLPGTRALAGAFGVHRNTVVAAFDELRAQGWLETARASHTRVTLTLPEAAPAQRRQPEAVGFGLRPFQNSARGFEALPRGVLDFSGGLPDARLFPAHLLGRAYRRALKLSAGKVLAFGSPMGDAVLRERLAQVLAARRGLAVTADDVLVTRGSQLALHLLSIALVRPGDAVAVESPGYPSAREAFRLLGAELVPVRVDAEGLDVAALERALKRRAVRAVYLTPHPQDPTTVTLSARRRLALLELARRHRFALVEADSDHEFQFEGAPVLPLAAADAHGVSIVVGSLSRALAPGLRMGFVVAPRPVLAALVAVRGQVDRQGDLGLERALAELVDDGEVLRHGQRARRVFHGRRDLLASLLRAHLGGALDFEVPRCGLGLWARVADDVDVEAWAAAALRRGARFFTGRPYMPSGEVVPFARFGFAHLDEGELAEAVRRVAAALPPRRARDRRRR